MEKDIREKIKQLELEVKESEKKLKAAQKELRKVEKYRGLKFGLYKNYGNGKYYHGLANDNFVDILRKLAIVICGVTERGDTCKYLNTPLMSVKELSYTETKLCNDFLEELYPLVEKYVDKVLGNK